MNAFTAHGHHIITVVVVLVVIFLVYFLLWKGRWDAIFPTESDDRAGQEAFQWVAGSKNLAAFSILKKGIGRVQPPKTFLGFGALSGLATTLQGTSRT